MGKVRAALRCWRARLRARAERGQALVEAAIVMPLMTFLILGVIQLVMIEHARIMTEYAAFTAVRAGIVWNADPGVMQSAAIISLMPTYEGMFEEGDLGNPMQMIRRIIQRALIYQVHRRLPDAIEMLRNGTDAIIDALPGDPSVIAGQRDQLLDAIEKAADQALVGSINDALGGSPDDMVAIQTMAPRPGAFGQRGEEIDFDDPQHSERTRLSIKVRYLYLMRVPFANWVIHQAWLASAAGSSSTARCGIRSYRRAPPRPASTRRRLAPTSRRGLTATAGCCRCCGARRDRRVHGAALRDLHHAHAVEPLPAEPAAQVTTARTA